VRSWPAGVLLGLLWGASARAEELPDPLEPAIDPTKPLETDLPEPEEPEPESPLDHRPEAQWIPTWEPDPPRWFFATRFDVGYPFIRQRLSLGYGRPHRHWVGLDLTPIIGGSDGGGYAGIRYDAGWLDVRTGALYLYSFNRSFLPPQAAYDRRDIDTRRGENAQFVTWDSEVTVEAPIGPLRFITETQSVYLRRAQEDQFVYVAALGVVAGRGVSLRQQLTLVYPFEPVAFFSIGPSAEVVWIEARAPELVFRAGAEMHWHLYRDLEVQSEIMPVVHSPDQLGFEAGQVLEVQLRWRWATH